MEKPIEVADTLQQNIPLEREMIGRDKHGAILELAKQGTHKKVIARMLGTDVKTVRRVLCAKEWHPYLRKTTGKKILSSFEELIKRRAVEVCRGDGEPPLVFETAPGQQGQADWGSSFVWFGEKRVRTRFFALVLGYSRRMFSKGYKNERLVHLLAGHEAAFSWLD